MTNTARMLHIDDDMGLDGAFHFAMIRHGVFEKMNVVVFVAPRQWWYTSTVVGVLGTCVLVPDVALISTRTLDRRGPSYTYDQPTYPVPGRRSDPPA
jgi:hypothetical protein